MARKDDPVTSKFEVLKRDRDAAACLADFEEQTVPRTVADHKESAKFFKPSDGLLVAINAALAVGAPLLLTGDPGTGKTQAAHWVARKLGFSPGNRFFMLSVQSNMTAEAVRYEFDNVAYFHAAYEQNLGASTEGREPIDKFKFVNKGVLWKAIEAEQRCVVLIDEIDKAPADFPNDLLHVLDQYEFEVRELPDHHPHRWVRRKKKTKDAADEERVTPPFVVITSNSERRLPAPFLRRCIFHELVFDAAFVHDIVEARRGPGGPYAALDEATRTEAIARFLDLRERNLRKKPSTAELLVWLTILSARGTRADKLAVPANELPAIGALIKDREDLASLKDT